jgi:CRP-like cAMP-binding protein
MDPDLLLSSIDKHIQLTSGEKDYFISLLHFKKLRRKQFLVQEGDINKGSAFVTSGILRIYSIDKNGFEHILQFAPSGWWIGDMRSFLTQTPGTLYIDAIEDSDILMLLKLDLDDLYNRVPGFERFFRILAENSIAAYQHRLINNLSLSAMERYNNFPNYIPTSSEIYLKSRLQPMLVLRRSF